MCGLKLQGESVGTDSHTSELDCQSFQLFLVQPSALQLSSKRRGVTSRGPRRSCTAAADARGCPNHSDHSHQWARLEEERRGGGGWCPPPWQPTAELCGQLPWRGLQHMLGFIGAFWPGGFASF